MMLRAYLPRLLIFTALGVLGGAGIAQAETAPPGGRPEFLCEQGEFCAWSGEFYTEAVQRLDEDDQPGGLRQERVNREARRMAQDADGHWEVERRAFFFHIGGTEVDHNSLVGRAKSIVADRR